MGQYYKGKKIGTCESMYCMRLSEAQELAKQGKSDDNGIKFEEYLTDNTTRFRFPFPDEDKGIPDDCRHNKGFDVPAENIKMEHDDLAFHSSIEGAGGGVNIFIPCLHSDKFKDLIAWSNGKISLSRGGSGLQHLTILFNAIRDGKEKTIFSCARCGHQQRFSDDDIDEIKTNAKGYYSVYKQIDEETGHKRTGGNHYLHLHSCSG